MKKIYILGSINFDLTMYTDTLPVQGETVCGHDFMCSSGGKGANQAVAASKLGGDSKLIGSVGNDFFGEQCLSILKEYGVGLEFIQSVERNTGTAIVIINNGDNRILIDHGANFALHPNDVKEILQNNVCEGDVFVTQMEVPAACVEMGLKIAKQKGAVTVLNPAPAQGVTDEMLKYVDIIVPNESEAFAICGIQPCSLESLRKIDQAFCQKGVKKVVVTLGNKGCYCNGKIYPAVQCGEIVDTTAAGDTFVGALCVKLSEGYAVEDALEFCQTASAVTVTRRGAQVAIPFLEELKKVG